MAASGRPAGTRLPGGAKRLRQKARRRRRRAAPGGESGGERSRERRDHRRWDGVPSRISSRSVCVRSWSSLAPRMVAHPTHGCNVGGRRGDDSVRHSTQDRFLRDWRQDREEHGRKEEMHGQRGKRAETDGADRVLHLLRVSLTRRRSGGEPAARLPRETQGRDGRSRRVRVVRDLPEPEEDLLEEGDRSVSGGERGRGEDRGVGRGVELSPNPKQPSPQPLSLCAGRGAFIWRRSRNGKNLVAKILAIVDRIALRELRIERLLRDAPDSAA